MKYRIVKDYSKDSKCESFFVKKKIPCLPIWLQVTEFQGLYTWIVNFKTQEEAEDYIAKKRVTKIKYKKKIVSEIEI